MWLKLETGMLLMLLLFSVLGETIRMEREEEGDMMGRRERGEDKEEQTEKKEKEKKEGRRGKKQGLERNE